MESDATTSQLVKILRWVATLPAAAISAWLSYFIMAFMGRFGLSYAVAPDSVWVQIYDVTIAHGCVGGAFVYVGAITAPEYKNVVSFILGGLAIAAAGFLAFPAIWIGDWWALTGAISISIGAGALVWSIHTGEIELQQ